MSENVININASEFKAEKSFLFELCFFTPKFGIKYGFSLKYGMFIHNLKKN